MTGENCEECPLVLGSNTGGVGGGAEREASITCFKGILAAPLELCGRCISVVRNAHTVFLCNIVKFSKEIFPSPLWTSF